MITICGPSEDWDEIAEATGDESWRGERMRAYFQRLERCEYARPTWWGRVKGLLDFGTGWENARHGERGWLRTTLSDLRFLRQDRRLLGDVLGGLLGTLRAGAANFGELTGERDSRPRVPSLVHPGRPGRFAADRFRFRLLLASNHLTRRLAFWLVALLALAALAGVDAIGRCLARRMLETGLTIGNVVAWFNIAVATILVLVLLLRIAARFLIAGRSRVSVVGTVARRCLGSVLVLVCGALPPLAALGEALLLTLAYLRLGYWWNSGLARKERPDMPVKRGLWRSLAECVAWWFRAQTLLLAEASERFGGPWDRYWHLSDGGNFESTGAYELLRRRVPFATPVAPARHGSAASIPGCFTSRRPGPVMSLPTSAITTRCTRIFRTNRLSIRYSKSRSGRVIASSASTSARVSSWKSRLRPSASGR